MATGVPSLLSRNAPPSLLVLNYHRILGRGQLSPEFDDGVFDADYETFRDQMRWLRSATHVLDEEELLRLAAGGKPPPGRLCTLVTFDDGYIDCFSVVKPVLDELGIRGIFFVPVEILESRRLGWWDIAAYLLKNSRRPSIEVEGQVYPLGRDIAQALRRVLNLFKLEKADRTEDLLLRLSHACGVELPSKARQSAELMDWAQVCQLRASGHSIGSHAWSHRPLATLAPDVQGREIKESRRELKAIVGSDILSFAYPVGGPQHFDRHSVALAQEAGYELAFTFNTGMSRLPLHDRFQIPRESAKSLALLRAKVLVPGLMGLRSRLPVLRPQ